MFSLVLTDWAGWLGWLAWLADWAGWAGSSGWAGLAGLFFNALRMGYSLLLFLLAICMGFKFPVIKPMQITAIIYTSQIKPMRRATSETKSFKTHAYNTNSMQDTSSDDDDTANSMVQEMPTPSKPLGFG